MDVASTRKMSRVVITAVLVLTTVLCELILCVLRDVLDRATLLFQRKEIACSRLLQCFVCLSLVECLKVLSFKRVSCYRQDLASTNSFIFVEIFVN